MIRAQADDIALTSGIASVRGLLTKGLDGSRLSPGGLYCPEAKETRMRLLLLEDEDDLRREICEYLTRRRHVVIALGSAAEARRTLETLMSSGEPLDAVICDINLRDGDGVELYAEFAPQRPGCRWILMSGDPDPQRLGTLKLANPAVQRCVVVEKPISLRELADFLTPDGPAI